MTKEQEKMFNKRFDKGTTIIEKYRGWYQALWPDDPRGSTVNPRKFSYQDATLVSQSLIDLGYDYLVRNPSPVIYRASKELAPGHSTRDGYKQVTLSATTNARLIEEVNGIPPAKASGPEPTNMVAEQNGAINTDPTPDIQSSSTAQVPNQLGNGVGKRLSQKDLSDTSLPSLYSEFTSMFNYSTEDSLSVSNVASPPASGLVLSNSVDTIGKSSTVVVDTSTQPGLLSYGTDLGRNNESEYSGLGCNLGFVFDDDVDVDDSEFLYMGFR
jgi:hypothetical protein